MRDIKFRAWNGEDMLPPGDSIKFKNSVFYQLRVTTPDDRKFTDLDCKGLILMQYTGLKDKNGKEIYEGDIICNEGRQREVYKVSWNNDRGLWTLMPDEFASRWPELNSGSRKYMTVIGNIYETPELLNEKGS